MKDWRTIRCFEDLEQFNIDFRKLSATDKEVITTEMLEYIEDYAKNIKIMPRQVEKPVLRAHRAHRTTRATRKRPST